MVAVGITIIFGVMKMVNFAAGEFVTVGMFITWMAFQALGWNTYALMPIVMLGMGILAYIIFQLCIRPLLDRERSALLLVTIGLSYFLQNFLQVIFGAESLTVPSSLKNSALNILGYSINIARLVAFIFAIIFVFLLSWLLGNTRLGRSLRATAENDQIAEMLGVNSTKAFAIAFIIGIVMSGVAGLLLTPIYYVTPSAGTILKTTPLMIVVLGGMGNIKGAMISGLLVGVTESLVATIIAPELGPLGIFIAYLFVVYFKPEGLFGKGERVG